MDVPKQAFEVFQENKFVGHKCNIPEKAGNERTDNRQENKN
jgi:hypothetical protein